MTSNNNNCVSYSVFCGFFWCMMVAKTCKQNGPPQAFAALVAIYWLAPVPTRPHPGLQCPSPPNSPGPSEKSLLPKGRCRVATKTYFKMNLCSFRRVCNELEPREELLWTTNQSGRRVVGVNLTKCNRQICLKKMLKTNQYLKHYITASSNVYSCLGIRK